MFETTMLSLNHKLTIHKKHMYGEHDFGKIKAEVAKMCTLFENQTRSHRNQTKIDMIKNLDVIECLQNVDIDMKALCELKYFTMKFGFLHEKKQNAYLKIDNVKPSCYM